MHFLHRGFSLIELMIVITIISILSTIAIPSYQFYTKRARFTEIISIAEIYKTAVTLALQEGIEATELINGQHDIPNEPSPTKNLASLKVENGIITATTTNTLENATYILTPNTTGDIWTISGSCLQSGLCSKE